MLTKRKKIEIYVTTGITVVVSLVCGLVSHFTKKNNVSENLNSDTAIVSTDLNVDDLGIDLEFSQDDDKEYGNTTGSVDKSKIVEDSNGTIWVDESANDRQNEIGNTTYDDKGGTLTKENGKIVEKENGYEVTDSNNNVVDQGNGTPKGYTYDETREGYVKEEDAGKYINSEYDFYDEFGNIIIEKGSLISKEKYEILKSKYSTSTPVASPNTTSTPDSTPAPSASSTPTPTPNPNGVTNQDGTYTIYGLTFETEEDYKQWVLQGYEGYGLVDGIMIAETEEMINAKNNYQKTK